MDRNRLHQRCDVCTARRGDGAAGTGLGQPLRPTDRCGSVPATKVNAIVAKRVAMLDLEIVLARCAKGGVPSSLIYSIAEIFEDTQYRAQRNIQMKESRAGAIAVPDVVPRLSSTPGEIRWLGEGIGAQNEEIFRDLRGIRDDDLKQLRDEGVI